MNYWIFHFVWIHNYHPNHWIWKISSNICSNIIKNLPVVKSSWVFVVGIIVKKFPVCIHFDLNWGNIHFDLSWGKVLKRIEYYGFFLSLNRLRSHSSLWLSILRAKTRIWKGTIMPMLICKTLFFCCCSRLCSHSLLPNWCLHFIDLLRTQKLTHFAIFTHRQFDRNVELPEYEYCTVTNVALC